MNFYILAGGKSSRMGANKSLMKLNDNTIIEKVIAAIPAKKAFIKVITNSFAEYRFLNCSMIPDLHKNIGPIAGVQAGLLDSPYEFNFFLASDLPLVTSQIIQSVLEKHSGEDIFGIRTKNGPEPLCTIYSKKCLPVIELQINKKDYSLHNLFKLVPSKFVETNDPESLFNLNSVNDWNRLNRLSRD